MSQKPNTYKVQAGDCLSLIAERLGFSVDELKVLNSEQIKDVDFIYAGDELNIQVGGDRTQLQKAPEKPACNGDACSSAKPGFVDVLYVPVHPETGKKVWYAITEKAKGAIVAEQTLLTNAITNDHEKTLQNLNDLGVLSKFENKTHDQFLSEKDANTLKGLNLLVADIGFKTKKKKGLFVEEDFIRDVAMQLSLNYKQIKEKYERKFKTGRRGALLQLESDLLAKRREEPITPIEEKLEVAELNARFELHVLNEVTKHVLSHIKIIIKNLEKKAISEAGKISSNDGTFFVYDEKRNFYTSEKQMKIYDCINRIIRFRSLSDGVLMNKSDKETESEVNYFWKYNFKSYSSFMLTGNYSTTDFGASIVPTVVAEMCASAVLYLNANGYALKEQCLSFDELVGSDEAPPVNFKASYFGPISLGTVLNGEYKDWRHDKTLKIDIDHKDEVVQGLYDDLNCSSLLLGDVKDRPKGKDIDTLLEQNSTPATFWAYYPTLALIRFIDATVTTWLSDVKSSVGANIPGIVDDLIWVKAIALARIRQLKLIAKERVKNVDNINYLYNKEAMSTPSDSYRLLWNLSEYKPLEKKLGLYKNEAMKADIQIVECSLLSTGGKEVSWVRGPAWYLPGSMGKDKVDISNGHVKNITSNISLVDPQMGTGTPGKDSKAAWEDVKQNLADMATGAVKNNTDVFKLNLKSVIEHTGSAFWEGQFHWQDGQSGDESAYAVDAQSQFVRFSAKASGVGEFPFTELNGIKPNLDLKVGGRTDLKLDLARAQVSFKMALPSEGEVDLLIPYVAKEEGGKARQETYDAGKLRGEFTASLYGFAGASCLLSAEVAFGPSAKNGEIGIRGRAVKPTDFNKMKAGGADVRVAEPDAKILESALAKEVAVDGNAKVDVFAGVEVGLAADLKCFWKPPRSNADFMELGSISAQVSASVGAGFSGEIRIMLHHGKLVVVISAKAVCGPGVSGSWAISLNALVADRFLSCLLAILNESGFRYVSVLGDVDEDGENPAFVLLNTYITSALLLGITLAEVLLLPVVVLEDYNKEALQEKYSLQIAGYLLEWERTQSEGEGRLWVNNLPPEVLANLLHCLVTKDTEDFFELYSDFEKRLNKESSIKVQAIALIFKWMAPLKIDEDDEVKVANCCQQFEKTLILMGGYAETAATFRGKWKRFVASFRLIKRFVSSVQIDKTNEGDINEKAIPLLNRTVALLGSKMQGYRYTSKFNGEEYYIAHRNEMMAIGVCEAPVKEQSMDQLMSENETIMSEYESIQVQKAIAKDKDAVAFNKWKIK